MARAVWLDRLGPDIAATLRRFPLAIALAALATIVLVVEMNSWLDPDPDLRMRAFLGLATAAVFATAGVFFRESRPGAGVAGAILAYMLPLVVVGLFLVPQNRWFIPFGLPLVGGLWLSVSAFTVFGSGAAREANENRFWWLNHYAFTTAAIAGAAFVMIAIGIAAIERSLGVLFGLDTSGFFYRFLLPIAGAFLTPVYWLATLPRLEEFDARALETPDFLGRAIGFLGQFILVPLLLAYSAILLAYTAQIALTWSIPQGMLGWMVLGYAIAGAAAWLVLHPPFMRSRALVRVFRRLWFWLTIIPLLLFALALWIRIDAYGLTADRLGVLGGGAWAGALTILFLLGRGDIRYIPGLAAVIILALTFGPWNVENASVSDQGRRLAAVLSAAPFDPASSRFQLTPEQADKALSASQYLLASTLGTAEAGRVLENALTVHAISFNPATKDMYQVLADFGVTQSVATAAVETGFTRDPAKTSVDVSQTPLMIDTASVWDGAPSPVPAGFAMGIADGQLVVSRPGIELARVDLAPWFARQLGSGGLVEPAIDFTVDGRRYRFALDNVRASARPGEAAKVFFLSGVLFAAAAATPTP